MAKLTNSDLKLLICPIHRLNLVESDGQKTLSDSAGCVFKITDEFIDFLPNAEKDLGPLNKKFQKFYDGWASLDWIIGGFLKFIFKSRILRFRKECLADLEIKPGDKVLEVSIGMGDNLPFLEKDAQYFGLDISKKSLLRCRKHLSKIGRQVCLFAGNAESLPFKDDSFDTVFHIGGINFFDDRAKAISEMIRVAKPGTKIIIIDETEQYIEGWYKKVPFVKRLFQTYDKTRAKAPTDLVPDNMLEINEKIICDNSMYLLSFIKPQEILGVVQNTQKTESGGQETKDIDNY